MVLAGTITAQRTVHKTRFFTDLRGSLHRKTRFLGTSTQGGTQKHKDAFLKTAFFVALETEGQTGLPWHGGQ